MTLKEALGKVVSRRDLTREEMARVMGLMLAGEASPAQVGALATALKMKGETEDEILGAAEAMRACATKLSPRAEVVLDTCGTGGDGAHTFNISTAVAFVAAGAGVTVAKHGNRAVSSRCGSADVLAALGVSMERPHERVALDIDEHGVGFLFALASQRVEARGAGAAGHGLSQHVQPAGPADQPGRCALPAAGHLRRQARGADRARAGATGQPARVGGAWPRRA